jgi:hypothetical protein
MAKVAEAPVPMRRELTTGASILGVSLALAVATIIVGDVNLGSFGVRLASAAVQLQTALVAIAQAASALWNMASVPLTLGLSTTLVASLAALKKLASGGGEMQEVRVSR